MGCTSSSRYLEGKNVISDQVLSCLIDQFNIYYEQIYKMRFELYDELEIPHLVEEQQELPCYSFDESILWERLRYMKTIYSEQLYSETCQNLKQQLKKLKDIENKLAPFLKGTNKILKSAKKGKKINERTEVLILETELKRSSILVYFSTPQIEETCVTNLLFRSSSLESAQGDLQIKSQFSLSHKNHNKLKEILQKKISIESKI